MCMECRQNPCHPRCPNAPEPRVLFRCMDCGEGIREGDDYYDMMGEPYCESCVKQSLRTAGDD